MQNCVAEEKTLQYLVIIIILLNIIYLLNLICSIDFKRIQVIKELSLSSESQYNSGVVLYNDIRT